MMLRSIQRLALSCQKYNSEVLEIDALMYIPIKWGDRGALIQDDDPESKPRRVHYSKRHPPKLEVPEHYNCLIKLSFSNTNHIMKNNSPLWVEYIFKAVFVQLV